MNGDAAGTGGRQAGTSGGPRVTSGRSRRVVLAAIAALFAYALLQLWANVGSILTERGADADPVTVWTLELTSLLGWLVVVAVLWRAMPHMLPPKRSWAASIVLVLFGAPLASLLHVGVMVELREIAWTIMGGDYSFPTGAAGFPYELRKDVADYALLVVLIATLQWYAGRPAGSEDAVAEPVLEVVDGTRRTRIAHSAIERIEAAGNYVEVHADGDTHLHRGTMAAMEAELGPGFARIHRSHLVRRDAIRVVEGDKSGDFAVTLHDGTILRGSRRYRDNLR